MAVTVAKTEDKLKNGTKEEKAQVVSGAITYGLLFFATAAVGGEAADAGAGGDFATFADGYTSLDVTTSADALNAAKTTTNTASGTSGTAATASGGTTLALNGAKDITEVQDLSTLEGATEEQIEGLIPKDWQGKPLNKGEGTKYANPNKQGETYMIEKGNPGGDPTNIHSGPYLRVSRNGKVSRIPLKGNPVLKK